MFSNQGCCLCKFWKGKILVWERDIACVEWLALWITACQSFQSKSFFFSFYLFQYLLARKLIWCMCGPFPSVWFWCNLDHPFDGDKPKGTKQNPIFVLTPAVIAPNGNFVIIGEDWNHFAVSWNYVWCTSSSFSFVPQKTQIFGSARSLKVSLK